MSAHKLTAEQLLVLDRGCLKGPRPGSNFWPLVELELGPITIPGEQISALIQDGLLVGTPAAEPETLTAGPEHIAECDVEATHAYVTSPAGRALVGTLGADMERAA